jgi:hypothetical protein
MSSTLLMFFYLLDTAILCTFMHDVAELKIAQKY